MHKVFVRSVAPVALAFAMSLVGCAKNDANSVVAPLSPTFTPAPGGPVTGATISGTVLTGAGASSLTGVRGASVRPAGVALTVSVVGTSVNAKVDGSGHFTLPNVPSGDLTLAFTGSGTDARITIAGVHAKDQIRITVNLHGNVAEVDENEHETENETEVEGRVASKGCPQTIVVGTVTPTTVNVQGARIRHDGITLTCDQIQVNDRVEAHGVKNGNMLVATDVNVETDHGVPSPGDDDDDDDNDEAEVKGTVAGAALGHGCPVFTFTVGTTTVTTIPQTKFEDTSCAGVVNGISVEAKGTRTGPTAITAMKVEKKK